eukprot:Trichotokara_eunicae@DN5230_c0_g1_i1.p1
MGGQTAKRVPATPSTLKSLGGGILAGAASAASLGWASDGGAESVAASTLRDPSHHSIVFAIPLENEENSNKEVALEYLKGTLAALDAKSLGNFMTYEYLQEAQRTVEKSAHQKNIELTDVELEKMFEELYSFKKESVNPYAFYNTAADLIAQDVRQYEKEEQSLLKTVDNAYITDLKERMKLSFQSKSSKEFDMAFQQFASSSLRGALFSFPLVCIKKDHSKFAGAVRSRLGLQESTPK